jgi:hypothetical protein
MSVPSSPRAKKRHRPNPKLTKIEISELVKRYCDGTSSVEIGRIFQRRGRSVTKQGIIFHLRREGVTLRKSQLWRKLQPGEVRQGRWGVKEPQRVTRFAFA